MLLALPMIPPARMNEYLQLLESEVEHLGSPSAQAFGHDVLAYIRFQNLFRLLFSVTYHYVGTIISRDHLAMNAMAGSGMCSTG